MGGDSRPDESLMPIVFISRFRIKDGQLDAFRQYGREMTPKLRDVKPGTVGFLMYLDPDGSELTIIHLFPDAEAMDLHFEGAGERSQAAYEFLVPVGWEIYGTPSEAVVVSMREAAAASGVTLTLQPDYADGFLRLSSS